MLLFKYTTFENALNILLKQKFRYTQPYCFNDPFELFPSVEEYYTDAQFDETLNSLLKPNFVEETMNQVIRNEFDKLNRFQKSILSFQQYFKIQKVRLQNEIRKRNLSLKELIRQHLEKYDAKELMNIEYHKLLNSAIGIFSLSKSNDNILMWSHYTESHSGVVIKINATKSYFEHLDEVSYSNDRPKIRLSKRDYSKEESLDISKKVFFNKSIGWAYESEYRDIKPLIKGYNSEKVDKNGFPIMLFDFPLEIIDGIIFGVRVPENKIIDFMSQVSTKYNNLKYEKASLNPDKFELNIYQISKAA